MYYIKGARLVQRRQGALKVRDASLKKLKELMANSGDMDAILKMVSLWIAQDQKKAQNQKANQGMNLYCSSPV